MKKRHNFPFRNSQFMRTIKKDSLKIKNVKTIKSPRNRRKSCLQAIKSLKIYQKNNSKKAVTEFSPYKTDNNFAKIYSSDKQEESKNEINNLIKDKKQQEDLIQDKEDREGCIFEDYCIRKVPGMKNYKNKINQDQIMYHEIPTPQNNPKNDHLIGVFDGHGEHGYHVSHFLSSKFLGRHKYLIPQVFLTLFNHKIKENLSKNSQKCVSKIWMKSQLNLLIKKCHQI